MYFAYVLVESQELIWLSRLHQLEELYLSENTAVADSTLLALGKGCPRLRYFTCKIEIE